MSRDEQLASGRHVTSTPFLDELETHVSASSTSENAHHTSSSTRRPPACAAAAAAEENDADAEGDEGRADDLANSCQAARTASCDEEHRPAVRHSSEAVLVPAGPSSTDAAAAAGEFRRDGERSASFGDETQRQHFV